MIRRAVPADADAISALWLWSRQSSEPAIPPPVHSAEEVREWFASIVLRERPTWVAENEGEIVALLVLEDGRIDQLYVAPSRTGQGLGSRLVDLAKEQHPAGLDLWTFESNLGARRFYERHGFVAISRTQDDNEERAPDIRYHWSGSRVR
ncbi:MAG: hypothetical protein JWM85_3069 [Acidimicrobiaceae bacterium]|nr:hypothetical protein [Acidimicrobiaceae bacterium]